MSAKLMSAGLTRTICYLGALAMLCLQINVSHAQPAVPLAPNGGGFIAGGLPELTLTPLNLITSINIPFSSTSFSGILTSSVYGNDASNPFGVGSLTFTYQYSINTGPDSSEGISLGGFTGFNTDVTYQAPTTGVPPILDSRSLNGNNIEFNFIPQITPGMTSALLIVQTDSQVFNVGTSTVLDNTGSPNVAILAPEAFVGVPEPTSAGFILLGLGVLASARRFRK
jgi:hypothetical protein